MEILKASEGYLEAIMVMKEKHGFRSIGFALIKLLDLALG